MSATSSAALPIISIDGLPGVARVEDVSSAGNPAMKIVFVDGVEATVTRALINKNLFDVWLPPDRPGFASSVMTNLEDEAVMAQLNNLALKAAATA